MSILHEEGLGIASNTVEMHLMPLHTTAYLQFLYDDVRR
jgi:hypothetical protein